MINLFLKARHWQLFLLILGLPLVYQVYMMISLFSDMNNESYSELGFPKVSMDLFPLVMSVFTILFFGWFWSMAIGLQKKIPEDLKLKTSKFKFFFFVPVIYILGLMLFMGTILNGQNPDSLGFISGFIAVIILLLHLFSMFCILYALYFVAKTIKTAELQRKVGFGDYIGEIFLLWIYFIGIWIIQPKVNKLVALEDAID